jgi:tRNA-splicing ligase RtcB (3'-phosphate/5'-hydroxy nucleic acid ligase)
MILRDKLKKITDYKYELPKHDEMKVPAEIFMSDKLIEQLEDDALQQIKNVASLPGIQEKSLAMPDAHVGYGFTIGGVAAIDRETGCISPGGIGFDINCGVRFLQTNLSKEDIEPKILDLLDAIFAKIPVGVGGEHKKKLTDEELDAVLKDGSRWALSQGYGVPEDCTFCESEGAMKEADPAKISLTAKKRGRRQLGTLGAGNHFLEIQVVDEIYDEEIAKTFGITHVGQITVMIHCGSRGLGHQVCSDYIKRMENSYPDVLEKIPEKNLIYAPAGTKLAQDYFSAMCASANYAWANRHVIAHQIRKSFTELFPDSKVTTVYDVAHNIAKNEKHIINGEEKECWVHRKGATRAFGPDNPEIPKSYRQVGQPIILPGSMGTASYILVGSKTAEEETFASTAHGAGRVMSRFEAKKTFNAESVKEELEKKQIFIKAGSYRGISEEAPAVYKDIDEVVKVSHAAGIGNLVAKVRPFGVIKG